MRSTREVFESHLIYTLDWNQEVDIKTNFDEECFIITSYGTFFGHDGVRKLAQMQEVQIPEADILYTTKICRGELAFLEWQAESDDSYIDDGASTYLIRKGKIIAQTIHYTVRSRER